MFEKTTARGLLVTTLLASAVTVRGGTINVFNMPQAKPACNS
jgi:hypothetical protein